ncbi:unnamed protein product [Pylaiella littoralis]
MVSLHSKKTMLVAGYICFNTVLTFVLFFFTYGWVFVSFFLVGGHARDLVGILYQLVNMGAISRPVPDIPDGEANTVCCLVPVYNEDPVLLKKNLNCLTTQNLSPRTTVIILLIFDGLGEHNRLLFEVINRNIEYDSSVEKFRPQQQRSFRSWKGGEDTRLNFREGRYNGVTVVLSYKEQRAGKKDSLITGERFILERWGAVDYIYHTDADTVADENCLNELLKSLYHDKDLDGVSALLRTYGAQNAPVLARGFVVMQDFQYFYSLVVRRMTESLMSSTTCLPGCGNMIRVGEKSSVALEAYGHRPTRPGNLLQTVTRMQGTDRRYTTLLLKQGANLRMNWRAVAHTEPPLSAPSFVAQRRRWSSNSFFNSIIVLGVDRVPLYVKVSTAVDIGRVFSTPLRFASYLFFWVSLDAFSVTNMVTLSVFLAIPYVYACAWMVSIVPQWKGMLLGMVLSKVCMPFLSTVSVTMMYLTATNFAW